MIFNFEITIKETKGAVNTGSKRFVMNTIGGWMPTRFRNPNQTTY